MQRKSKKAEKFKLYSLKRLGYSILAGAIVNFIILLFIRVSVAFPPISAMIQTNSLDSTAVYGQLYGFPYAFLWHMHGVTNNASAFRIDFAGLVLNILIYAILAYILFSMLGDNIKGAFFKTTKRRAILIIFLLAFAIVSPAVQAAYYERDPYAYMDVFNAVYGTSSNYARWVMSFKPSYSSLKKVKIFMYRDASYTADLRIRVVDDDDSASGGNIKWQCTGMSSSSISTVHPSGGGGSWVECFSGSSQSFTSGRKYYIYMWSECTNSNSDDYLFWVGNYNNPYSRGSARVWLWQGSSWGAEDYPDDDLGFAVYKYVNGGGGGDDDDDANNPPGKAEMPSGETWGQTNTQYSYTTSATDPDGDSMTYQFSWDDGTTSSWGDSSQSHSWSEADSYNVKARAKDVHGDIGPWSDILVVHISANSPPNTPSAPDGPAYGGLNEYYSFSTFSSDPEGDSVSYRFSWGDTAISGWGASQQGHTWSKAGSFEVKAQAKDSNGATSAWSSASIIDINALPPQILRFTASKTAVDPGEKFYLEWETENVASIDLYKDGTFLGNYNASDKTSDIYILKSATFTINATGLNGDVLTSSVKVSVGSVGGGDGGIDNNLINTVLIIVGIISALILFDRWLKKKWPFGKKGKKEDITINIDLEKKKANAAKTKEENKSKKTPGKKKSK